MRYQVLGPVELFGADGVVRLGGPKQRAVLALLLLNANQVVSEQRFVSMVWGVDAPLSVRGQLQMYVSQLRKLIGEPVIVRRPPGYLIQVRAGELDLAVFDESVRQARADREAGRADAAVEGLRFALALWRGPALSGVTEPLLDREGPGLSERRLGALEEYFDARLAAGWHEWLVREVREVAEENPFRERLQAQLMVALHRSGRTAEALEVYGAARSRLVAEKGVEPGPLLRETQLRLLRDEDRTEPASFSSSSPVPVPRQLPGDVPVFAGRSAELARLDTVLPAGGDPAAPPVIVIAGGAGTGKTTLAVHWARRVKGRFPDGQLYVNLRGYDPSRNKATPDDVVRGFLQALNLPATQVPASREARFTLYRSLVADKRVLVVLDNARDVEQVRPLLPGSPGCLTVVTSRNQLPSLIAAEGAVPLVLGLLSVSEAREMLTRRLGAARVDAEPEAVAEIATLCARLPLALAIVAARAVTNPDFLLSTLAGELAAVGLDAFDAGDPLGNVRAVFSWSYLTLDPPAARLFRLLGLHPGPHATVAAAASMLGEPMSRVRPLLTELTRANLATETRPGWYSLHDLLRAYATELTNDEDPECARREAIHRMLDHYFHTAWVTDRFLRPQLARPGPDLVPDGVTVADVRTETQAVTWYAGEHEAIAASVGMAVRAGLDAYAWQLSCALTSTFWHAGARWLGGSDVYETAMEAARRVGGAWALGLAHRSRALYRLSQQRIDDAEDDLTESLRLFEEVGDRDLLADVHLRLGWVSGRRDDHSDQRDHAETALRLFRATGNRIGTANSYNDLASCLVHFDDHEQAVILCKQALAILEEIEYRMCEAATWSTLGLAHVRLGLHDEAIRCYERANELHRKVDGKLHQADTHTRIGEIHLARGATGEARQAWQQAVALFEELRLPDHADTLCARLAHLD